MIQKNEINRAVELIQKGKIIIIPTDTLFGFSFDACNSSTIENFNKLKMRKSPLSIIVNSMTMAEKYGKIENTKVINQLLPGSFTCLFEKKESDLSSLVTCDSDKIGIRIPQNDFCLKIVEKLKRPITTTSVNFHGKESLKEIKEIKSTFPKIPFFGEKNLNSNGSTIIDFTQNPPKVIRQGDGVFNG